MTDKTDNDSTQLPLEQLRQIRINKLNKLRELGIDPYPSETRKDTTNIEILSSYEEYEDKRVIVAGRVDSKRGHGKLVFMDVKDASGVIQLYIKKDNIKDEKVDQNELGFSDLDLVDEGDFVEAEGNVTKTRSGEVSVEVKNIRIITKSLRSTPKQLKDKETRFRRRYIDTNVNKDVYDRLLRRAKFWQAHREFFNGRGFSEMGIPVLEHIIGGGDAIPFVTHMNAIDEDFYLRISHELPLKRLIGGGYEKVYDIGPRFRNEGLSDEHLPEHYAMEFYWAYANWQDGMKIIKELFEYILKFVYDGKTEFDIRGFKVDFSRDWELLDFADLMRDNFQIDDIYTVTLEEIEKALKENNIEIDFKLNIPRGVDYLWKSLRKDITGPAFLINHPKYLSPLQKVSKDNPNMVERFQPIIAGSELGTGWSEVNDPIDQFERFSEQQKLREAGDEEAQWLDIDYVEMLEYGMPPTFGYGHSERVFWFLEDVSAREGVPFPQLKFEIDDITRKIYGLEDYERK